LRRLSYKWVALLITTIGSFMSSLDGSIVNIALPAIASDLKIGFETVLWVPVGYLLVLTILLISFGRLADIKGRKKLFNLGFAIFTVGSALCGVSQTGIQLLLSRILQGMGGALLISNSAAIVTDAFPGYERGKALGVNAMAVYIGLVTGPILGGFLVQYLGWRSVFYVNIPIGIFLTVFGTIRLKELAAIVPSQRFDLLGAGTFSFGLAMLLLALTFAPSYGWFSNFTITLFALSLVFLFLFIFVEGRRAAYPMIDLNLFLRSRLFSAANLTALLNYTAISGVGFLMSFYLQVVLGYATEEAGLIIIPMPLVMAVLSPLSGWASDKVGSRLISSAGMAIITFSFLLLSSIPMEPSSVDVAGRLVILGLGMGLFSTPNTSAVMGSVPKERLGVAAGVLGTMRSLGMVLGVAIMGVITAASLPLGSAELLFTGLGISQPVVVVAEFVTGVHNAFLFSALVSAAGIITSLIRGAQR
jgi:EmrB/QacA subfamily drug resistance transporter